RSHVWPDAPSTQPAHPPLSCRALDACRSWQRPDGVKRFCHQGECNRQTTPSVLTVGCDSSRSLACCQERSSIQCCVLYCFFACASLLTFDAFATIDFSSGLSGRGVG